VAETNEGVAAKCLAVVLVIGAQSAERLRWRLADVEVALRQLEPHRPTEVLVDLTSEVELTMQLVDRIYTHMSQVNFDLGVVDDT